jgi:hypothetical protein
VNAILPAALAETALVTWRAVSKGNAKSNPVPNLPLPSNYTSVILFYGALALIPESGATFAAAVGWGMVIATLLNFWDPAGGIAGQPKPKANPTKTATPAAKK